MIKRIIFEGTDRLGKSTQIGLLEIYLKFLAYDVSKFHFTSPTDKRTETQLKNFVNILYIIDDLNCISLCDRDIYGEYVYGPLYRQNNPNFIWQLENVFKDLTEASIFFLFEDSISNILKREDGDSFTKNYWKKLYEKILFRIAFYKSKIPHKKIINIKGKSIQEVHEIIINYIVGVITND
jgi:thymidylate kinase